MLIPIAPLTKYLTTSLIAPHGITDLVHAKETNHTMQLLTTYSLTNGGVLGLNYMHYDNAVNILLFLASVMHFQRDIPFRNKTLLTSMMLLYFIFLDNNSLFLYLSAIHVPHHYKLSWPFLKKNKPFSFFIIGATTALSMYFGKMYYEYYKDPLIFTILKGIICSHICYEEMYIYSKELEEA